jgi:arylsulfatase
LVQKDADGEVHIVETGDHLGRKSAGIGGGVGLVVGLFAPPLLAAAGAATGAVLGKFAKHRLQSGIAEKMDTALPPGPGA